MQGTEPLIGYLIILVALIVTALLVQQIWLAFRIEGRNDEWLDAMKAVSDELEGIRDTAKGAEDDRSNESD